MATVNYFSIFAFVCLAVSLHGSAANDGSGTINYILASVREYPTDVHRCSATFITQKFLVTTASCLLCTDKCQLFVGIITSAVNNLKAGPGINVKQTFIHPKYHINPKWHNVGIIELEKPRTQILPFSLPDSTVEAFNVNSTFQSWQFAKNRQDIILVRRDGRTLTHEVCSNFHREYVSDKLICFQSNELISVGPFDHGATLFTLGPERAYILGMFSHPDEIHNRYVFKFQSIIPFVDWINSIVNPNVDSEYNGDQNYGF